MWRALFRDAMRHVNFLKSFYLRVDSDIAIRIVQIVEFPKKPSKLVTLEPDLQKISKHLRIELQKLCALLENAKMFDKI